MRNFFRNNALPLASIVVAVCSLFVAVVSLRYTVNSQQEDRKYKELMIQPVLQIVSDTDAGSVLVANSGLGPAKILRVLFHSKDHCFDTDTIKLRSDQEFQKYAIDLVNAVHDHMFVGMPVDMDDRSKTLPAATGGVLPPDTIIQAGKEITLFKFDPTDLHTYLAKLDKIPGEYHQMFLDNFTKRSSTIPIQIEYCSLSGEFCHLAERPLPPCPNE